MEFVDDACTTTYTRATKIQSGMHGHVYKTVSSKDGLTYALKVVPDDVKYNDLRIFKTHAMQHENVVRFYGHFRHGGASVLVLEYCDGGSLQARLKHASLTDEQVLRFAKDLFRGLAFLHDVAQIIHLDIKPQNLLTTRGGRLCICDFSLSISRQVNKRGMFGARCYMAPEMFLRNVLTPACDVWSAGCVVYFMVRGQSPFEWAQTPVKGSTKLIDAICAVDYTPLGTSPVARVVHACLQRLVSDRLSAARVHSEFFLLQGA